jgi:hypothetical protein
VTYFSLLVFVQNVIFGVLVQILLISSAGHGIGHKRAESHIADLCRNDIWLPRLRDLMVIWNGLWSKLIERPIDPLTEPKICHQIFWDERKLCQTNQWKTDEHT